MDWEQVAGNWTQLKGQVKETWGELTDDELEIIDGQWDQLVGFIQSSYGVTKEQAERQVQKFCSGCSAPSHCPTR